METSPLSLESYYTHDFTMNVTTMVTILSSGVQNLPHSDFFSRVHFFGITQSEIWYYLEMSITKLTSHRTASIFRYGLSCPLMLPDGNLSPAGSGTKCHVPRTPTNIPYSSLVRSHDKDWYTFLCKVITFEWQA